MKLLKTVLTPPITAISIALAAVLPSFATTYFVIPGGEGDGSSWANGASLDSVLVQLASGDELRLKQGVHTVTAKASLADVELTIRGGYPGESESEEPVADKHLTVISNDAGLDNVWVKFDPETETETIDIRGTGATEPEKVIQDGKLNLPPALSDKDYVVYYPAHWDGAAASPCFGSHSAKTDTMLSFTGASFLRIENLTFSGFGKNYDGQSASIFLINQASVAAPHGAELKSVDFIGNCSRSVLVNFSGTPATGAVFHKSYTDCAFMYNRADYTVLAADGSWCNSASYTNCTFASICGRNRLRGSALAISFGGRPYNYYVVGCTFDHLVHCNTTVLPTTDAEKKAEVALACQTGTYVNMRMLDCTFSRNWVRNTQRTPLLRYLGNRMHNVKFVNNYSDITYYGTDEAVSASLFRNWDLDMLMDRITAVSNCCRFTSSTASAAYVAPFCIPRATGFTSSFFMDNAVEAVLTTEGGRLRWARSILDVPSALSQSAMATVANCTFCGSTPGDDIVLATSLAYPDVKAGTRSYAFNSIFWSSAADFTYSGMTSDLAGWGYMEGCIVKNKGLVPGNVTFVGCFGDDPMLAYDAESQVARPTVRVRGMYGHSDVYYDADPLGTSGLIPTGVTNSLYHVEMKKGAGIIFKVTDGTFYSLKAAKTRAPDLLGSLRKENDATAGAVETVLPEGHVFAATLGTPGGGVVSLGSQYAVNGQFLPVTATAADGYAFAKWVDETGATVSTDATFTPTDTAEYQSVRAVFQPPKAKWTFRVNPDKGAFADGTYEKTYEMDLGEALTELPQVVANADWHVAGWTPDVPALVTTTDDRSFDVAFIPYKAIMYYDSNVEGGAKDGSSWENAFSALNTAMDAAAATNVYVVEMRVKRGVHRPTGFGYRAITFPNVQFVGGFTGEGDARVLDRRATVFCGDFGQNDVYLDKDGNVLGRVFDDEGRFFDFAQCQPPDGCLLLDLTKANVTDHDNYGQLFSSSSVDCEVSCIENMTFTGYQQVLSFGGKNLVRIRNCDFIGSYGVTFGCTRTAYSYGATVANCNFLGLAASPMDVNCQYTSDGARFEVRDCLFRWICSRGGACVSTGVTLSYSVALLENCEFCDFYSSYCALPGETLGSDTRYAVFNDGATGAGSALLRNCSIHDIRMPANANDNVIVRMAGYKDGGVFDCAFSNIEYEVVHDPSSGQALADIVYPLDFYSGDAWGVQGCSVSNCTFRNITAKLTDTGTKSARSLILVDLGQGHQPGLACDLRFENCEVSSDENGRVALAVFRGDSLQGLTGTGYARNCKVASTGAGYAALLCGYFSTSTLVTAARINGIGVYDISGNVLETPNCISTVLIENLSGSSANLTVVGNRIEGGTSYAAVAHVGSTPQLVNVTIADNIVTAAEEAVTATLYCSDSNPSTIGWSTFYDNDVAFEFYRSNGTHRRTFDLTSSVVENDRSETWTACGSFLSPATTCGIKFANSYVGRVAPVYVSGTGIYTNVAPQLVGPVKRRGDRRKFVFHSPKSPYAMGDPELAGVFDAELAGSDARGVTRPEEDVRIGAVQDTYLPPGLSVLIR